MMKPAGILFAAALLGLAACRDDSKTPVDPVPGTEDGIFFADSLIVLSEFNYSDSACAEVLPDSFANSDVRPAEPVVVQVTSISCYAAHVDVVDSALAPVRSFTAYLKIYSHDGDKNRGHLSYIGWDGRDDKGAPAPLGKYRMRIRFDFGAGHSTKYYGPVYL